MVVSSPMLLQEQGALSGDITVEENTVPATEACLN